MARTRYQEVRRSQKKSYFLREISSLIMQISYDEPLVAALYVTRVELSEDGGVCYIYFSAYQVQTTEEKKKAFEEARHRLVLYKGSMRSALAKTSHSRYVPHLRFMFDEKVEKELRVNDLLTTVMDQLAEVDEREKHVEAEEEDKA